MFLARDLLPGDLFINSYGVRLIMSIQQDKLGGYVLSNQRLINCQDHSTDQTVFGAVFRNGELLSLEQDNT